VPQTQDLRDQRLPVAKETSGLVAFAKTKLAERRDRDAGWYVHSGAAPDAITVGGSLYERPFPSRDWLCRSGK
jgi:hypothetical protein